MQRDAATSLPSVTQGTEPGTSLLPQSNEAHSFVNLHTLVHLTLLHQQGPGTKLSSLNTPTIQVA